MRGAEAPAPPFFLSASPEGFCGGGGPSTHQWAYPAHPRGSIRLTTKGTKSVPGLCPWTPVRGYRTFRARSALLRLAPCCFLRFYRQPCKRGSMGDTFPRGSRRPPLGR